MTAIEQHIAAYCESQKNQHLIIACSGGLDSVAMLHLLHEHHHSIEVIHVNYSLRGEASDADESFVKELCNKMDVSCSVKSNPIEGPSNLQERARIARYLWFEEKVAESESNRILLAHHLDDQVETFFMNIARNSGVMGLAAMKEIGQKIHRPLLGFTKEEIRTWALNKAISWRKDASNESNKYTRNKLRNVILPQLQKTVPGLSQSVHILTLSFQRKQESLEKELFELKSQWEAHGRIKVSKLLSLDEYELVEIMRQFDISIRSIDTFKAFLLASNGAKFEWNNELYECMENDGEEIILVNQKKLSHRLHITACETLPDEFDLSSVYLDKNIIQGDLRVRSWKISDRIDSIGVNGSQLISKIIRDAKVSGNEKRNQAVVYDNEGILWCAGLKLSKRVQQKSNNPIWIKVELISESL